MDNNVVQFKHVEVDLSCNSPSTCKNDTEVVNRSEHKMVLLKDFIRGNQ